MLTPQVKEAFDEIQNNRLIGEIPPENPYVFAKAHSLSAIGNSCQRSLRAYANACGLGHITARSLRMNRYNGFLHNW
jgi:hypothetical protein